MIFLYAGSFRKLLVRNTDARQTLYIRPQRWPLVCHTFIGTLYYTLQTRYGTGK